MSTSNPNDILSSKQVAAMIGVRPGTMDIMRHRGGGPRFGKISPIKQSKVIYRRSDVEAWLNERFYNTTAEYTAKAADERKA